VAIPLLFVTFVAVVQACVNLLYVDALHCSYWTGSRKYYSWTKYTSILFEVFTFITLRDLVTPMCDANIKYSEVHTTRVSGYLYSTENGYSVFRVNVY